jgi:hypothetical protein
LAVAKEQAIIKGLFENSSIAQLVERRTVNP